MERAIASSPLLSGCREIVRHVATPLEDLVIPPAYPHRPGHYSCTVAHAEVLTAAWSDDVETLLVLEDDADPLPALDGGFSSVVGRLPSDWLGVWLGGYHQSDPVKLDGGLCRLTGTVATHAYLLNRGGMECCRHSIDSRPMRVVDQTYCQMHSEVARFYAPDPFLIGTIASYSDIDAKVAPAL